MSKETSDRNYSGFKSAVQEEPYPICHFIRQAKKLWFSQKKLEDIFVHNQESYDNHRVKLMLGPKAVALETRQRAVRANDGAVYQYGNLLLATRTAPQSLTILKSTQMADTKNTNSHHRSLGPPRKG
jgi:NAD(P)H-nitrite reductase large subunit